MGEIVLSVQGVSKRFGGTQALDDVSLDLERGKVLALLGENGAGKSTLIKILAGVHAPDEGTILFRGVKTSPAHLPIAFIHQDLGLIDWMTVAENVCLSLGYPSRAGLIKTRAMRRRAQEALDKLGVVIDPDARVEQLTRTEKALVAVSRALGSNADIVVMDEPTASLPGERSRAIVRCDREASQRGGRCHIRLASSRRGVSNRRFRRGPAGRARRRRQPRRRHHARESGRPDRRPRAVAGLSPTDRCGRRPASDALQPLR